MHVREYGNEQTVMNENMADEQIVLLLMDYVRERKSKRQIEDVTHEDLAQLVGKLEDRWEREMLRKFLNNRIDKLHFFSKNVAKHNITNNLKRGVMMASTNYLVATFVLLILPIPLIMLLVGTTGSFVYTQIKHQVHVKRYAHEIMALLDRTATDDLHSQQQKHSFWKRITSCFHHKKESREVRFNRL